MTNEVFASALVSIFIVVSHLSILAPEVREPIMMALTILIVLFGTFSILKIKNKKEVVYLALVFLTIAAAVFHNFTKPALTDYAAGKRIYFFIAIIVMGIFAPAAIKGSREKLKLLAVFLVYTTLIFAFFTFMEGTTANLRRSGLELNPTLHSKLLFYPAILIIAAKLSLAQRPIIYVIAAFAIFSSVKTGSRGALLSMMMLPFIDSFAKMSLRIFLISFLKTAVIIFFVFNMLQFLPEEISSRFSLESLSDQSDEGDRLFLWALSAKLISENPFGIGMGNLSEIFWVYAPHNIILEALLDLGIIGATPILYLLFRTLFIALAILKGKDPEMRFFALLFLFSFLNALIGGELSFPSFMLYLSMGIINLSYKNIFSKSRRVDSVNIQNNNYTLKLS